MRRCFFPAHKVVRSSKARASRCVGRQSCWGWELGGYTPGAVACDRVLEGQAGDQNWFRRRAAAAPPSIWLSSWREAGGVGVCCNAMHEGRRTTYARTCPRSRVFQIQIRILDPVLLSARSKPTNQPTERKTGTLDRVVRQTTNRPVWPRLAFRDFRLKHSAWRPITALSSSAFISTDQVTMQSA
jgi:hypothetical protein